LKELEEPKRLVADNKRLLEEGRLINNIYALCEEFLLEQEKNRALGLKASPIDIEDKKHVIELLSKRSENHTLKEIKAMISLFRR